MTNIKTSRASELIERSSVSTLQNKSVAVTFATVSNPGRGGPQEKGKTDHVSL